MKFGGASLGSADNIRRVLEIVRARSDRRPLVVVSALAGVTDALLEVGSRAPAGDADTTAIEKRHRDVLAALGLPPEMLEPLLSELSDLARGMKLVGEASPRALDHLASIGERCSARIVAAFFAQSAMPAAAVDAWDAGLRTDSSFGRARPLPDDGRIAASLAEVRGVPVVTGFIAKDEAGNITTLGRNGSDYSAALFGGALDAEEIQVWKDVEGVMTADPKVVPEARPIRTMSFDEASELAWYGSKVLHPATILPAMEKSIPVRVLSIADPESSGTLILPTYDEPGVTVRAVVHKKGVRLLTLVSPRMLAQHGFLAKVFEAAADREVDVDLVATSEVSITMTVGSDRNLAALAADLRRIGEVSVESGQAMVCVVGHRIAQETGVAATVLETLHSADVRVRCISLGAIKVNIALVVAEEQAAMAARALHARFFPAP